MGDELQAKSDEFSRRMFRINSMTLGLQTKYNELQTRSDKVEAKSNAVTANAAVVYGVAKSAQTDLTERVGKISHNRPLCEQLSKTVIRLKEQLVLAGSIKALPVVVCD